MPSIYIALKMFVFELFWSAFSRIRHIQSECGKMQTRITPNTGTFQAVLLTDLLPNIIWNFTCLNLQEKLRKHYNLRSYLIGGPNGLPEMNYSEKSLFLKLSTAEWIDFQNNCGFSLQRSRKNFLRNEFDWTFTVPVFWNNLSLRVVLSHLP